ncbi:MAG: Haloalkane dehalogenase [Planctomycetota bacterium]
MNREQVGWRSLYPYDSHYLALGSQQASGGAQVRLHYIDEGPRGGAPELAPHQPNSDRSDKSGVQHQASSILCVHGNPTWSFYYRSIVDRFSATNRVVAVDHIGCGMSDKPPQYAYTLQQHTDNLVALIDAIDLQRIVMVVHDWGGAIGLGAALRRLDRMAGLVVLNTGAFPPPYVPLRIAACRLPWIGSFAMRHLNAFARAATVMAIDRLPRLDTNVRDGLLAPYDTAAHRVGIDGFVKDIPMSKTHPTFATLKKLESDLPKLGRLPIRLVWGMKDWCFTPECLRRFKVAWPNASVRELSDVGHYVMEEAASEVCEELAGLVIQ